MTTTMFTKKMTAATLDAPYARTTTPAQSKATSHDDGDGHRDGHYGKVLQNTLVLLS